MAAVFVERATDGWEGWTVLREGCACAAVLRDVDGAWLVAWALPCPRHRQEMLARQLRAAFGV